MESGVSPAAICLQLIGLSAEQLYVLSAAAATVHALIALWIAFHAGLQCVCLPAGEAPKAPKPPVLGRPCTAAKAPKPPARGRRRTAASSRRLFRHPGRPPQTPSSHRSTSSRRRLRRCCSPGRPPQTPSSHLSTSSRRRSRRCCRVPHVLAEAHSHAAAAGVPHVLAEAHSLAAVTARSAEVQVNSRRRKKKKNLPPHVHAHN